MKLKEHTFLVIYGPTGVGKTDVALALAERIPAEIINMDMGQCYTPLSIGTAKPDWRSMKTPHHLFDYINEPRNMTVVEYRQTCLKIMQEIWSRGKLPILVGGSGFYLQSIFFPPTREVDIVSIAEEKHDQANLWDELNAVDPDRAKMIHRNDTYRLKRAMAIWHATGNKPSDYMPAYNPPAAAYDVYCLTRERDELYERIDARVNIMMREGWIEETKKLLGTSWESFLHTKKIIGYADILEYISGDQNEEKKKIMIHAIQQKTRNYAKRQMTFWRKIEKSLVREQHMYAKNNQHVPEVVAINLTLLGVDLYIKQLLKRIDTWFA